MTRRPMLHDSSRETSVSQQASHYFQPAALQTQYASQARSGLCRTKNSLASARSVSTCSPTLRASCCHSRARLASGWVVGLYREGVELRIATKGFDPIVILLSCAPDATWLNPTRHKIAVHASPRSSPSTTQRSLPRGRYAGRTSTGRNPPASPGALTMDFHHRLVAGLPAHRQC